LQIYFPFQVVALSAVRCEGGAAGEGLPVHYGGSIIPAVLSA
jgi:hypothetical protein